MATKIHDQDRQKNDHRFGTLGNITGCLLSLSVTVLCSSELSSLLSTSRFEPLFTLPSSTGISSLLSLVITSHPFFSFRRGLQKSSDARLRKSENVLKDTAFLSENLTFCLSPDITKCPLSFICTDFTSWVGLIQYSQDFFRGVLTVLRTHLQKNSYNQKRDQLGILLIYLSDGIFGKRVILILVLNV